MLTKINDAIGYKINNNNKFKRIKIMQFSGHSEIKIEINNKTQLENLFICGN
jgi:hypothetical protein